MAFFRSNYFLIKIFKLKLFKKFLKKLSNKIFPNTSNFLTEKFIDHITSHRWHHFRSRHLEQYGDTIKSWINFIAAKKSIAQKSGLASHCKSWHFNMQNLQRIGCTHTKTDGKAFSGAKWTFCKQVLKEPFSSSIEETDSSFAYRENLGMKNLYKLLSNDMWVD